MSDNAKVKQPEESTPSAPAPVSLWKRVLRFRWMLLVVIVSLAVDCAVLVFARKSVAKNTVEPEYTVGTFAFRTPERPETRPTLGTFNLHVRFIEDLEPQARHQIVVHQFRVQ